ncbi:multi-sensor hybrid histidine kinase [Syntrophobotulus glycolicus DSM 8271]|uniref:Circadian input-output histidine kinase CikA n=1 Tax=Syntrophobotulus glycolicus (strain DSM 8271 / FlGlyR) TaxID=645991 RepID=F0STZ6_SYNGF|nr:ATP-binding protein [Syntrophobotulus glycolicus]ADY56519.1 multi-sensor hybrid histidine kinase [Syntrophobotulus glycolicus DSM 8271]
MAGKFVIKHSTISALMLGIFFLIAILLGSSILYMNSSIHDERVAEQRRTEFKQLGINLATASDYLTDEARKYAVTKDVDHMNKYWEEINTTKTRDEVIARLGELNSPSEEMTLLAEAKRNSDALVETERHSMRLVLEADDVPEANMPIEVAAFHLNAGDQQLNPTEKLAKARNIMFDAKYAEDKESIMGPIASFQSIMNNRLEAELAVARQATTKAAILQTVLAVIIICAVAGLIRILFRQVTSPINQYTERLKVFSFRDEKFSLVPDGSLELRMLAQTFNALSNSFQEELVKRKKAEETMKAAKEEAETANKAKSEFLAQMSHEIRTPLHTIIGYQYLLENTFLEEKQTEYVRNLGLASKNLLEIINEILDFSKLEAKKMVLEAVDFDLYLLIEDLCSMLEVEIRRKKLQFNFTIKPDVPRYLKGDTTRLKQVILNLLSNGIKFTHEGSLQLFVELKEQKNRTVMLCFHVADTGIGIPQRQIEQLFEVFTQGDTSTSRKYGGSGLGLAISKKIVRLMGGDIFLKSVVGEGSTFSFTAMFELGERLPAGHKEKKTTGLWQIFCSKKLLLVEDNAVNLEMTKEILLRLGFTVEGAESGFEALKMVGENQYDAILMDIRMPEMDGYETARRVRMLDDGENIPIIALSADALEGVVAKAKQAGMNNYLTKPLDPAKMINVLRQIFNAGDQTALTEDVIEGSKQQADIDLQSGLRRIGGKRDVYRSILVQFIANHRGDGERLKEFIGARHLQEARQLAHTVKGVAANIGANSLKQAAQAVGKALRDSNWSELDHEAAVLVAALSESCAAAEQFVETLTANDAEKTETVNLGEILGRLLKLSEDGDAEAKRFFERYRHCFAKGLTDREYHRLHEKIFQYSLDEAAVELQDLIKIYGNQS